MSHKGEMGIDVIRRWKAGRVAPFRDTLSSWADTFAEDLVLFERQVRDEVGPR